MEIGVALAQMAVVPGEVQANEAAARDVARQAAESAVDLLVLPEMWPAGYDLRNARHYAAPLDAGPFRVMSSLAREYSFYVTGTALEENGPSSPFNTAALYAPDGSLVGAYRKVHLWAPLGEVEHMTAGSELPAFDLPWGCTALAICYDLRFPEMWRAYRATGASVAIIPAAWPSPRVEHWRVLLRARAIENQCFVIGCNRAGGGWDAGDHPFAGYSVAVDPWGHALAEGGSEPDLVIARLDLFEVERARRLFPFWSDRRPDVYKG